MKRIVCGMQQVMRDFLCVTAVPLFLTAGVLSFNDDDRHVAPVLAIAASAGAIIGQMRKQAHDDGKAGNAVDLELLLRAVLATRSQPSYDQVLRLVADGEPQSAPQPPHRSAG